MSRLVPPGILERLRADVGIAVVVVAAVTVTVGTATTVSRALERLTATSVRDEVANTPAPVVGVTASTLVDRVLAQDGALRSLAARGATEAAALPPPLDQVVSPSEMVVDSVRFLLQSLPDDPPLALTSLLTFRAQDPGDEHLEVVEGRVPAVTAELAELPGAAPGLPGPTVAVHEVAMSATTLARLGLQIGDRLRASPDTSDPLARRAGVIQLDPIVVEVVGRIELSDPQNPVWWGDPRLQRPAQFDTGVSTTYFAFGWVPVDDAGLLPGGGELPAQVDWRFDVGADAVAAADPQEVLAGARALTAANAGLAPGFGETVATSRLDRVMAGELVRRGVAINTLRLGIVAVGGVGVSVLGLLAVLLDTRRRERTALTRGRGASRGQLLVGALVEAFGLVLVGTLVGLTAAVAVVPGGLRGEDLVVAGLVGVSAVAAIVVAGTQTQRQPLRELLQADDRDDGALGLRGWVVEGVVVLLAVAGVVALRRRGVDASEPDAFVVLVPVLVGVASGLVVRHLHRLPIRAVAVAARRRRGLAAAVGFVRGSRSDVAGPMVVVVVLAVAVALFAGAVASTIQRGQRVAAWEDVGAPWRIESQLGEPLEPVEDVGVASVTGHLGTAAMNSGPDEFGRGDVLVTDLGAMEAMLADTEAPLRLTTRALRDVPVTEGAAPILPAVVSETWFNNARLGLNDQVDVTFGTDRLTYQVVATRQRVLGLDQEVDGPFMVLPRRSTEAVLGRALPTIVQFVDGGDLGSRLREARPDALVTGWAEDVQELASRALPRGVVAGFTAIAVVSLVFASLALVVWQALTARRRVHDLAILAALGTGTRSRFAIAMAEGVPAVLMGVVAGSVVGRVVGDLLDGVIDLAPFTGTASVSDVVATATVSVWGAAAIATVALLLVGALTWRGASVDTTRLLRRGE